MKESTTRNLQLYSNFSLICILGIPISSEGQIIYTDIDPDQIVLEGGEYYLDIDLEAGWDFQFINDAGIVSIFTSATSIYYYLEGIWVSPRGINDVYTNQPPSAFSSRRYPIAMEQNSAIFEDLHFDTYSFQRMAWRKYVFDWNGYSTTSHYCCAGGYWFPEQTDKYLGVRFADAEGLRHYGWIRCDVKDEGRTLIVKDYAYEATPEKGILAGDTLGLYVSVPEGNSAGFDCHYFQNTLSISLASFNAPINGIISNAGGAVVFKFKLAGSYSTLDLPGFPAGYYFVTIQNGSQQITRKILIN